MASTVSVLAKKVWFNSLGKFSKTLYNVMFYFNFQKIRCYKKQIKTQHLQGCGNLQSCTYNRKQYMHSYRSTYVWCSPCHYLHSSQARIRFLSGANRPGIKVLCVTDWQRGFTKHDMFFIFLIYSFYTVGHMLGVVITNGGNVDYLDHWMEIPHQSHLSLFSGQVILHVCQLCCSSSSTGYPS